MSTSGQLDPRFLSPMPAAGAPTPAPTPAAPPPVATTPMFDPSGTVRQIPADQAPAALAAGGKPAYKMLDPTGTARWIPQDSLADAAAAGGTPASMSEARRVQAALPKATGTGPMEAAVETLHQRGVLGDQDVNFIRSLARTYKGASDVVGHFTGSTDPTDFKQSVDEVAQGKTEGKGINWGGMAETVGEWMAGEGEANAAMTGLEKMQLAMPVLKIMKKYPKIGAAIAGAIKQGVVGAGQTYVKTGGDTRAALTEGAETAGLGGLTEGIMGGGGAVNDAVKPGVIKVGGEDVPVLASQREGASSLAGATTAANTPEFAAAQQAKAQKIFVSNAQQAAHDAIDEVNQTRGASAPTEPITDQARQLPGAVQTFEVPTGAAPEIEQTGELTPYARKRQIGTTVEPGNETATTNSKGVAKSPIWQYLTDAKPGSVPRDTSVTGAGVLRTTKPEEAQAWLSRLKELDQAGNLDEAGKSARDQLQQQLDMYHAGTTQKFIDPAAAASQVRSYGEAADQIRASVRPIYQKLDALSGGRFQTLKNAFEAGQDALRASTTDEEVQAAHQQIDQAHRGMNQLFEEFKAQGGGGADYAAAQAAWSKAATLDTVHNTIEGMFNGVTPQTEADTAKAGFKVSRKIVSASTKRIGALENSVKLSRLKAVLGQDGVANLAIMSRLLENPSTRSKTFQFFAHTGHYAGRAGLGAAAGAAVGAGTAAVSGGDIRRGAEVGGVTGFLGGIGARAMVRSMATNGRVAKMIDYAVRNGVDRKIAGPLIAAAISADTNTPSVDDNQEAQQ